MLYWLRSSFWIWSKAGFQLVLLVANFNDASAGRFRQLVHLGVATITKAAIESAIGDQNHIANRVGLLCRLNRILDSQTAALVFTIGKDDHRLAAHFVLQLLVGSKINRVVE